MSKEMLTKTVKTVQLTFGQIAAIVAVSVLLTGYVMNASDTATPASAATVQTTTSAPKALSQP